MRRGLNVVLNCLSWRLIPSLYGSFKVIYTYYLFLLIWCLTFCLRASFLKFLAHTLLPHLVFFFNPFISRLCASSACVTRCFPLLWLTTLVSSGATTCVFGLLHQYWCQHTSVPSVQSQAPEANALIHKVEWTRLFGLMDVTYRTREKRSHYIYVGGFLNALVGGPSHCWLWLQFAICFALFSNIIHVLKWAKSSLNP